MKTDIAKRIIAEWLEETTLPRLIRRNVAPVDLTRLNEALAIDRRHGPVEDQTRTGADVRSGRTASSQRPSDRSCSRLEVVVERARGGRVLI